MTPLWLLPIVNSRGKPGFIASVAHGAHVLDVGCGSDSPALTKKLRPDLYYVGIDVQDYNHKRAPRAFADEYLIVEPSDFATRVGKFGPVFDAVISSHNIEHCDEPEEVIAGIVMSLKVGGRLFMSFPAEASINFPRRRGCLNFYDDKTHKKVPNLGRIMNAFDESGLVVEYLATRYRRVVYFFLGMTLEPLSATLRRRLPGTWDFWGFETIIWARKKNTFSHVRGRS